MSKLKPSLRSQENIYNELVALSKMFKETPDREGTLLDYCLKYRMEALMWTLRLVEVDTIVPTPKQIAYMKAVL